ncbi:DNA adenine methylase [Lacticaseibacillus pantheris]|jgi:DNA adenine methylase
MNNYVKSLLSEHNLTVREIGAEYKVAPSTLSDIYNRDVDYWPVWALRETAEQLELSLDVLVDRLNQPKANLRPFIKWVGGKRQLLSEIDRRLPQHYNTYFEPFLGGGAVLLHLQPSHAVINDYNTELVNAWRAVRDKPELLLKILEQYARNNSKEFYLNLRAADRDGRIDSFSEVERAARFVYLNKTGFNGLWRVNKAGQNNVPYGKYINPRIKDPIINEVGQYLKEYQVTISAGDYRKALKTAAQEDFVYLDSPYDVVSKTSSFTGYTANGFGSDEQVQLRDEYVRLSQMGVQVMESNADTEMINRLYTNIPGVKISHIKAKRAINSKGDKRGPVGEVLITNYQY